jgi:lipopolysaccharide export system permease protein
VRSREYRRDFYYFGDKKSLYFFEEFRTRPYSSSHVWRQRFDGSHITQRVRAQSMEYRDSVWYLIKGSVRNFTGDSSAIFSFDTLRDSVLNVSPDEMVVAIRGKEEMSYWELKEYIDKVRRQGEKVSMYMADLHFKTALPLMNLIVIILGISVTARMGRKGGAVLFGIGLALTFSYWIIARFALAFAQNGQVSPLMGAWFGNILFFILGIVLYRKAVQ